MPKFTLYQDPSQWIAKSWWYWKPAGAADLKGHGPYPFKSLARLAGWLSTR